MDISKVLKRWYLNAHRPLPWRETSDPYRIWLSEIILQQTRIQQGTPYYYKFIEAFPTVVDLAEASENEVIKLWQGLGYYSRARNLHSAAKMVRDQFNGTFPSDYHSIRSLKGVGDYTAAAIASFAFGLPYAVVDGNVYRFIARFYGINTPIDSTPGKKIFQQLAFSILDKKNPGVHNQAIMEFGATVCTPAKPDCAGCIFKLECIAFNKGQVQILPVKEKKTKSRIRYFNYLIVKNNGSIFMKKRLAGDIWQHLYDFPLIETSTDLPPAKVMALKEWKTLFKNQSLHIELVSDLVVHKLSHQQIVTRFFEVRLKKSPDQDFKAEFTEIQLDDLHSYPVPRLIQRVFEERLEGYSLPPK